MYINYQPVCIIRRPLIDIHESHYLRFARLYSKNYNQNVDKSHLCANYSLMEYLILDK